MKTIKPNPLLGVALFALTAAGVTYYPILTRSETVPAQPPSTDPVAAALSSQTPVVEAVFVLDTTGSMGGLIQAAKDKIWSIASTLAAAQPAPIVRMGLVAYRDRGDDYVTRVIELSPDLDALHTALFGFQAQGGGDGPESVNQALHEAVERIGWSRDPTTYRVLFLVGDAPPHLDYPNDVPYTQTLDEARRRGIRVNAIQCGEEPDTRVEWQRIAQLGNGGYFSVDQDGGAVAIATPYDASLASLSRELDETRLYYGAAPERAKRETRDGAAKSVQAAAAPAVLARRAEYAVSESGKAALVVDQDLVEAVATGQVDLAKLPASQLPAPLAELDVPARAEAVRDAAAKRESLRQRIQDLATRREGYLKDRIASDGGARGSLDHQIWGAIRQQGAEVGLKYDGTGPRY